MTQVNVTPPHDRGDRTAAAGINFLTVVVVLLVLLAVAWFLFSGPLTGVFSGGDTNVDVNVPAEQVPAPEMNIEVNPPSSGEQTAPGGDSGGTGTQP